MITQGVDNDYEGGREKEGKKDKPKVQREENAIEMKPEKYKSCSTDYNGQKSKS